MYTIVLIYLGFQKDDCLTMRDNNMDSVLGMTFTVLSFFFFLLMMDLSCVVRISWL